MKPLYLKMISKRQRARDLLSLGKEIDALKLMGTLPFKKNEILGQKIIEARDALLNPSSYKQIGIDSNKAVSEGISAMKKLLID